MPDIETDLLIIGAGPSGAREDRRTKDEPENRDLRLRLRLVEVDGAWLTSEIQVVD